LIAAVGQEFSTVHEVATTGTHLSPYRRTASEVPNNALNRIALHSLDKAIAAIDPSSTRIYLSLPTAQMNGATPSKRGSVAIEAIVEALEKMPQRLAWDRIVVATPAFRALDQNGMASKLRGFGIFDEQACQGGCGWKPGDPFPRGAFPEPLDGVDAVTTEDKTIKARTYLAPFSYIEVWVLDPKTLAVLDKRQGFDSQKLAEPHYRPPLDASNADVQKYLASRFVNLVELSIGEALMRSEINLPRGKSEVGPIREIGPDGPKK
jgi:hypothetical protein